MDAQKFLSEFKHIVSATGGLQRLRELVLQLAVSGRLVERNWNEESVESALLEAKMLKKRFETDLELGHTRLHTSLQENEYPYEIPKHWQWERLEKIACYIQRGKQPNYVNSGTTIVVSQKCIQWTGLNLSVARYVDEASLSNYGKERFLQQGDLLWNSTGTGTVGRVTIYDAEKTVNAVADSHVTIIRLSNFVPRYVWSVLASPWIQVRIAPENKNSLVTGTTKQVELATSSIKALAIPCPPIAEQQRIVAKVDELMSLCDKLEAQQQEQETLCKLATTATLHALANAEDSLTIEVAWARTNANISLLFDSEQGYTNLQYSLIKLAVRGFLSTWTNESPPLDEIKEECFSLKQQYIYNGSLRSRQPVATKQYENYTHPPHWGILPLDEVAVIIGGITKGHKLNGKDVRSQAYLSVANVQRGFFDLTTMKHIEVPLHQIEKYRVESGDLLITEGGDWDKVGRTAIWAGEIPDCLHQNHIFKARVPSPLLLNEWVELVLNSEIGRDYFAGASKQTTNLASINMTQLRSFPLPIPPLSEQVAILQKVNHLLSICQQLKQQRIYLVDVAQMLASAAISSLTGIQIEDKEKMKIPKTELVSTLRIGVSPANSERATLAAILIRNKGEIAAKTLWQASGLEIDAFYQQLKAEMAKGWIVQQQVAYMKELEAS
jgi:type I restriction enzyme, S subunit